MIRVLRNGGEDLKRRVADQVLLLDQPGCDHKQFVITFTKNDARRFAAPGKLHGIGVLLDEAQRRELLDELVVEGGLGVVVDLGERLRRGEAREAQPAFEPAALGRVDLIRGRS